MELFLAQKKCANWKFHFKPQISLHLPFSGEKEKSLALDGGLNEPLLDKQPATYVKRLGRSYVCKAPHLSLYFVLFFFATL